MSFFKVSTFCFDFSKHEYLCDSRMIYAITYMACNTTITCGYGFFRASNFLNLLHFGLSKHLSEEYNLNVSPAAVWHPAYPVIKHLNG